MCTDIWQYVIHRMLHIPFFFKHFHSQHHQYIKPYALSGLAGHWVEYIILPFPAICLGPWLVDLPMIPLIILFMILAAGNISGHNGHEWMISSLYNGAFHDLHHTHYQVNYGALQVMDKLFGTYMPTSGKKVE